MSIAKQISNFSRYCLVLYTSISYVPIFRIPYMSRNTKQAPLIKFGNSSQLKSTCTYVSLGSYIISAREKTTTHEITEKIHSRCTMDPKRRGLISSMRSFPARKATSQRARPAATATLVAPLRTVPGTEASNAARRRGPTKVEDMQRAEDMQSGTHRWGTLGCLRQSGVKSKEFHDLCRLKCLSDDGNNTVL